MDKDIKDSGKTFRPRRKKKVCIFCAEKVEHIDYKDVARLRKNLSAARQNEISSAGAEKEQIVAFPSSSAKISVFPSPAV